MRQQWMVLFILLFSCIYAQGGYSKQQWDDAREESKLRARRAMAELIHGYFVQYRSVLSLRENRTLMQTDLSACSLPLLKYSRFIGYKELGLLRIKATISKIAFIDAINAEKKARTNQDLTIQEYQDFRYMFPDTIEVYAFGACSKNPQDPGRRYIDTVEAYKVEASVRLVNYLKGPTLSAVSRLNNFFLTQDTIEAFLPKTLLRNAVFCVSEPNKRNRRDISLTIMITGSDWIYSVASALKAEGKSLSDEEYLKLKNRFARYPERYITFRLPDETLLDPNDTYQVESSSLAVGGSLTEPPLGFNEQGEKDILWK